MCTTEVGSQRSSCFNTQHWGRTVHAINASVTATEKLQLLGMSIDEVVSTARTFLGCDLFQVEHFSKVSSVDGLHGFTWPMAKLECLGFGFEGHVQAAGPGSDS